MIYSVFFSDFCGSVTSIDYNPLVVGERLAYNDVKGALQAVAVVKVYGDDGERHLELKVNH